MIQQQIKEWEVDAENSNILEILIQILSDFLMYVVSFHEYTQNYYHLQRIINLPPSLLIQPLQRFSLVRSTVCSPCAFLVIKNKE